MTGRVLLIEDDAPLRLSLAQSIELAGMEVLPMASYVQARRYFRANFPGVVLSDIRMPHQDGFDVLASVRSADEELPVVLLTGHSDVPTAMRAMKEGAWDYLEKPCSPDRLVDVLTRALAHRKLVLKSRQAERELLRNDPAAVNFPGSGAATEALRLALRNVAKSRGHVHLTGAGGVGKRQAAYVINQLPAERVPILRFNFAIGATVDLSPLREVSQGVDLVCNNFEQADFDQVSEILDCVGTNDDVRLISLSQLSLPELQGNGLEDRPEVLQQMVEINLPTIDERHEDLPEIFEVLLRQTARNLDIDMPEISDAILADILCRNWDGNLPELRSFATSYALGIKVQSGATANLSWSDQVEAFEKMVLIESLKRTRGSAPKAAQNLGLPRNTFYDRLSKYDLSAKDFRS
ncbi:MAG: response regulator [Rhizobiaceae bacterium]